MSDSSATNPPLAEDRARELANLIRTHMALKGVSPGFFLTDFDYGLIANCLQFTADHIRNNKS